MSSIKKTKKQLPEILDKFASNSEKVTNQLGEMSSQLSAFVDMLSENVRKESRRKDIEDNRREKARTARDQKESDKAAANKAAKDQKESDKAAKESDKAAANKLIKDQKESDKAAKELQQAKDEYAEGVSELDQINKDEIQNARQKEIAGLKEKGTPFSDIANKNLASGNIVGGLFASIFAIKEIGKKKKLKSLEKEEKDYTEQEEFNSKEEKKNQAKKKIERVFPGGITPTASLSPSKIINPEDQIKAETVNLNDDEKLKQSQEQTKDLGILDDNISKIWTDPLQVSVVDISDPTINKLKGIFSGLEESQKKSGGILSDILGLSKFLPEIIPALGALLAPLLIPLAAIAAASAVWYGLEWMLNNDAKNAQQKALKEEADRLAAAQAATKLNAARITGEVNTDLGRAKTESGYNEDQLIEYARSQGDTAYKANQKDKAAAYYAAGRDLQAKKDAAAPPTTATTTDGQPVVDVPAPDATTAPTPSAATAPTPAATTATAPAAPAAPSTAPTPSAATAPKSSSEEISKILKTGDGFNTVEMSDGTVQTRKGDRNWRNNNPGNIEWGPFAQSKGAIGTDGRFAIFPTYVMGRQAKSDLLFEGKNYKDLNIKQAISRYAPPTNNKGEFENDTPAYIKAVTSAVGGTENTNLRDLTSDQRVQFLTAVQKQEGFRQGNIITESPSTPQTGVQLSATANAPNLVAQPPQTGVQLYATANQNQASQQLGSSPGPIVISPQTTIVAGGTKPNPTSKDQKEQIPNVLNTSVYTLQKKDMHT